MDSKKVDLVIQYALAVAGEAEDFRDRELGPIHLLKFVYLADLAYARAERESFTGASWKFHKFGPWAVDVYQRIQPAIHFIGASERRFSATANEEGVRWRVKDACLSRDLEPKLPWSVAREVKHAVHQYGSDTTGLLHFVYRTPPMLRAAPGEALNLLVEEAVESEAMQVTTAETKLPEMSKTKVKKLQALVKGRLEERRRLKTLVTPEPAPRYDEVFTMGQDWLDGLAGDPVTAEKGQVHFSDEVWKSPGRRDPEIP
ncbi:MAG TPA: hypothetical protein VLB76_20035 [Thermoanaerobaculia bacterium]|jgi:hypothetical protein|nr:hypothetical protein [Thermoanaerobaculia bacterium]